MNGIVNKFILIGDRFMPELHLKQPAIGKPRFTSSTFGPFTKNKESIQKFKETGDTKYIYRNELDKTCFQNDMAYRDFKNLARRTGADKVLRDKAFNIAKDPKYDGYQRRLASMVYKFFDKKTKGSGIKSIPQNEQLVKELHIPKNKVYSAFKDNICGVYLADMQLINNFNKGFRFLLCVIDIFSKYARVIPLKDKKGVSIANAFQKILKKSNRKQNKTKYG